jgi:hypothetical protein
MLSVTTSTEIARADEVVGSVDTGRVDNSWGITGIIKESCSENSQLDNIAPDMKLMGTK